MRPRSPCAASAEVERARARLTNSASGSVGATVAVSARVDGVILQRLRESESVGSGGVNRWCKNPHNPRQMEFCT